MTHWSDGYNTDIDYKWQYFSKLNPKQLAPIFLKAGLPIPQVATACELGFGMGLSTNIHAAASNTKWYGTDFNPNQALIAKNFAKITGTDEQVALFDEGFAEFCYRDDLPDFDFIALHGIWSWISDENRKHIVEFVRRKLKVGGVLYISYNALPGWAGNAPLRHLLSQIDQTQSFANQSRTDAVKVAIEQAQNILALSNKLTAQTPTLPTKAKELEESDPRYLVHEYLNQDWQPMYFSEMESHLSHAKVSFVGAAEHLDNFEQILYSDEQQALMDSIQNPSYKQTIKDYLLNTQFRSDLWVKGRQPQSDHELKNAWDTQTVMLLTPPLA